jgi:hypothetical protein
MKLMRKKKRWVLLGLRHPHRVLGVKGVQKCMLELGDEMMGVGWDEGDGAVAAADGESDGTVGVEAGGAGGQRKSSPWDA